ncbi:NAD(P)-dependent oxidoreductase [Fuscovulum ytuae]|uniref:NAD(P)-dependent oxidoreductase n=2 Tax=Fuscovulum ytuae TaxID=3042299 RepID=A0ABY8QCX4_9RHOB|nr:NAD(P)-dependent oxidoreductase [Fuscovulum sp. YMD61]WGV17901.1 NAD(P)-dependent oxidoreductase [Fuscovulum sp. YMD61]
MTHGICGLGRMGAAMAERLLAQGVDLVVWNRDPAKAAPLVAKGAKQAESPAALAAACDTVITMLYDAAAVEQVYSGPQGLLSAAPKGKLFIEMSTIGPEAILSLGQAVAAAGADLVECPVGGTIGPAREGRLLGLVGGSADAVALARPTLAHLCRRVEHAGPLGAGARLKLAVNLPLLVYWQALREAMGLVSDLSMTPEQLADLMADTSGACMAVKHRAGELAALLAGTGEPGLAFEAKGAAKDLSHMVETASAQGQAMPVTAAARDAFIAAAAGPIAGRDAMTITALDWAALRAARR